MEKLRGGDDLCPEIQNRIGYEYQMMDIENERRDYTTRRGNLIESLRSGYEVLCAPNVS